MSEKTFSKKEALAHGFAMTKKYFKVVVMVLIIYIAYGVLDGILSAGAGADRMHRFELADLYEDQGTAGRFYEHLQKAGYINHFGTTQPRLDNLRAADELVLPPEFEGDRERIFAFLKPYTYHLPFPKPVYYLLAVAMWLISVLMGIGLFKMSVLAARDQEPAVAELYSNVHLIIPYLLASICYGLAVLGGFILLIVPGIIFMVMLGMYPYFIVDQNIGPIAALKASRALTKGVRRQLFLFGFVIFLVNIGGFLCLIIGLLATVPATYIASAYVYDRLLEAEGITPAAG